MRNIFLFVVISNLFSSLAFADPYHACQYKIYRVFYDFGSSIIYGETTRNQKKVVAHPDFFGNGIKPQCDIASVNEHFEQAQEEKPSRLDWNVDYFVSFKEGKRKIQKRMGPINNSIAPINFDTTADFDERYVCSYSCEPREGNLLQRLWNSF